MNIAIIHYHLNRGGVAQVIKSHLRAMDLFSPAAMPERVLLVYGGRREGWFDPPAGQREPVDSRVHEIVIPELDYDEGVPVEWLGRGALLDMLARSYNATLQSYRRVPLSQERLEAVLDGKTPNGRIDFGDLGAEAQVRVIRKVHGSVDAMKLLVKLNPFLRDGIDSCDEDAPACRGLRDDPGRRARRLAGVRACLIVRHRVMIRGLIPDGPCHHAA